MYEKVLTVVLLFRSFFRLYVFLKIIYPFRGRFFKKCYSALQIGYNQQHLINPLNSLFESYVICLMRVLKLSIIKFLHIYWCIYFLFLFNIEFQNGNKNGYKHRHDVPSLGLDQA